MLPKLFFGLDEKNYGLQPIPISIYLNPTASHQVYKTEDSTGGKARRWARRLFSG